MVDDRIESRLPSQRIERVVAPLVRFLHVEQASGVVLLACTIVALVLANSTYSASYLNFWGTEIGFSVGEFEFRHSLKHYVNDGLMVLFFFVIGLEIKRELVSGELRDVRRASLPIAAALGGMIVPAAIYFALESGSPAQRGWGIPMATDIAFVVGCMAILGSRVPHQLRVLLLSLAIVDDIGAILVIAIGYTEQIHWNWLIAAAIGLVFVNALSRVGVRRFFFYVVAGVFVWFAFHESGVHATVAGVILGLMTPAKAYISGGLIRDLLHHAADVFEGDEWEENSHRAEDVRRVQRLTRESVSPLEYLENSLHPWTSFVVMPVFALANAGVPLNVTELGSSVAISVMLGLVVGKPLGIFVVSWLAVRLGLAQLSERISWAVVVAAGCLAGIGFTMALFIAELALDGQLLDTAKLGVLAGSTISAILGMGLLLATLPRPASGT